VRTAVRVGGVIKAEASVLFACLSDFRQAPLFIDGLESLAPVGDTEAGEGARFEAVMKIGPRVFGATIVISALKQDRLVTWSSASADGQSVTFKLTPEDSGGTRVVMEVAYEKPTGLTGAVTAPVVEEAVRHRAHVSLRRLRDHVT
jgi:uncharacterized membrane protein